jgi:hypothetical protein
MYLGYACHQILRDRINEFLFGSIGADSIVGGTGNDSLCKAVSIVDGKTLLTRTQWLG